MTTPKLGLTELAAAQAIPETRVNENFRWAEFFACGGGIKDRDLATPPGSPVDGDAYLVASSATGAWSGEDGNIAMYLGTAWAFVSPIEGMQIYVNDEDTRLIYDGSAWNTPAGSSGSQTESLIISCSDETTALTAGAAKVTLRMPYAFTLSAVRASLTTAQTSGSILTVDINEGGSSILSTKLTIDNTEKSSTTAATAAVISDSSLADDAEITIDIDQVGDGTATGLKVYLIGQRA